MAPVSTGLYEVLEGYDIDELQKKIGEVQLSRDEPKVDGPLRTRFDDIHETSTGFSASMAFELPKKRSTWDGREYRREKTTVRVRFTDSVGDGGVLVIGKSDLHSQIESRLLDLFSIEADQIEKVNIDTENILSILDDDCIVESRATYKGVDENTSSASLAGELEESSTAARLEKTGQKVWVIFESKSFERKVGISEKNSSVVFWGNWDDDEMARYWSRIILHHI
ncbi:hypothetical protein [Haloarchaeobius sp. TZWWS8]|uniref:hypothetical protein n=1 Tax=Haloarchaeobius sp. TZWWS8 TaxID=3446121 RepID=UPI003EBD0333